MANIKVIRTSDDDLLTAIVLSIVSYMVMFFFSFFLFYLFVVLLMNMIQDVKGIYRQSRAYQYGSENPTSQTCVHTNYDIELIMTKTYL